MLAKGIAGMSGPVIRALAPRAASTAMPTPPASPPPKRARIMQPLEQLAKVKVDRLLLWWVVVIALKSPIATCFYVWIIAAALGCGNKGCPVSSA